MNNSCRGVLGGAKSATACITSLRVAGKIILADFNLAVSTLTAKLPNFNSPSNFPAIRYIPHIGKTDLVQLLCSNNYKQVIKTQSYTSTLYDSVYQRVLLSKETFQTIVD